MQYKRCCFAGHSRLPSRETAIEKALEKALENLITEHGVQEFWVGGYGDFDACAARVLHTLKGRYPFINRTYVVPYLSKIKKEDKAWYEKNFDETMVANVPETAPPRYHIIKANEFIVSQSDFLICYVQFEWGGAYRTLQYAKRKKHIQIINLYQK